MAEAGVVAMRDDIGTVSGFVGGEGGVFCEIGWETSWQVDVCEYPYIEYTGFPCSSRERPQDCV